MIVPFAAGGPTDTYARIVAEQLSNIWNQQVVIDNKGGAGSNIGNAFVAHSGPDGYTMLFGTSSLASNGALYRSLDYSPTTDLTPISLVARCPFFMFVPNSSPAKTVKEFIDYVKAQPGKLIIATPGTGGTAHLAELLFLHMAGIQMMHAPYRGAAPAFIDLIPGRVHCYFGSGELLTYSRSGQVRVLGSTGAKRSPATPDVPTVAESGVPGYTLHLEVQSQKLDNPPYDFDAAFRKLAEGGPQMLLVLSSPFFTLQRSHIAELAMQQRLPTMFIFKEYAQAGGLMSHGTDPQAIFRPLGFYVSKVLRGSKPSDLPVEQAVKFEFVVNLKTAKAIGVDLPTGILLRADEVIE
jgi:tripartite-type tricarboxylate transporter receptor subunit TctC